MYTNSYQSGLSLELYNSQSKELAKNWKFSGQIVKDYDQFLKNYTTNLINGGSSKIHLPPNDKITLGIVQGYIVFQIYVFSLKSFSIEIFISDTSKTRRRLIFSTNTKELIINSMHCRIPLVNITINTWINLSIDVISFASECFKSQTFRSIEYISITGNCKIKKIFSMRNILYNNLTETNPKELEQQNKIIGFPPKLLYENVNINIDKIKNYVDNEIVSKCSQIISKANNQVTNNNYTNPLNKNTNNIVVITAKKTNNNERISQIKKQSKGGPNPNTKLPKNVVFISRKEINDIGKSPDQKRSKSNNPYRIWNKDKSINKSRNSSMEKTNSIKLLISSENNSNDFQKNHVEINKMDPKHHENHISIKKNNFTLEGSIKSNKSMSRKGHSHEKSTKNIYLNSPHYGKSIKNTENDESIEELYELDDFVNNNIDGEKEETRDKNKDAISKNLNSNDKRASNYNTNSNIQEQSHASVSKNITEYTNLNFNKYYDIPIIDNKGKTPLKRTEDNFLIEKQKLIDIALSKKELLDEMFNENVNDLKTKEESERPYTPPITKLVNTNCLKTIEETNSLRESKNRLIRDNNEANIKISYHIGDENYLDLVFDPVMGYYYDPKKNIYYELKNN